MSKSDTIAIPKKFFSPNDLPPSELLQWDEYIRTNAEVILEHRIAIGPTHPNLRVFRCEKNIWHPIGMMVILLLQNSFLNSCRNTNANISSHTPQARILSSIFISNNNTTLMSCCSGQPSQVLSSELQLLSSPDICTSYRFPRLVTGSTPPQPHHPHLRLRPELFAL